MDASALKALYEGRVKTLTELRSLATVAEGREFTADEAATEKRYQEELDRLDAKIAAGLDRLEKDQRAAESLARYEKLTSTKVETRGEDSRAQLNTELRSLANREVRSVEVDIPGFHNLELRDLTTATANMPLAEGFESRLYVALRDNAVVLQAGPTLLVTGNGEAFEFPRATAHGNAAWIGESTVITESDPTLSSVTLNAWKAAQSAQVSQELVADLRFDLVGYLADSMGQNCGDLANTAYVNGDGVNKPAGIVPNATVGFTGPIDATPEVRYEDLVELEMSVKPGYRLRSKFVARGTTIKGFRLLKDTAGQFIWSPTAVVGQPSTLLGYPIFEDPNVPAIAASAKSVIFGDFRGYVVRIVSAVRFERSDHFAFNTDQVTFKAILRTDGKLIDSQALKVFQHGAAA